MSHSHNHDHYDGHAPPSGDDHDHGHGGHGHSHDHSDDITPALQNLLYEQVDFSKLMTLNEERPNSGRAIVQKTWAERLNAEPELKSDADEQLLMLVPFTGQVRLHSILLRTSNSPTAPKSLHIHMNRDDLDFSTASELKPTQTLELAQSSEIQEHPVKRALFNTTRSLSLFFPDNWSDGEEEVTGVSYLAFKGEFMRLNKEPVSFLYEAAANPKDHTVMQGLAEKGAKTLDGL